MHQHLIGRQSAQRRRTHRVDVDDDLGSGVTLANDGPGRRPCILADADSDDSLFRIDQDVSSPRLEVATLVEHAVVG